MNHQISFYIVKFRAIGRISDFKMSHKILLALSCCLGFLVTINAEINYCVLEECVCSTDTIICSGLISQTNGRFQPPEISVIKQIRLYNSYLTYLDFLNDFPDLELLGLRDCIVNCGKLESFVSHRSGLIIDVATTCPGMKHVLILNSKLTFAIVMNKVQNEIKPDVKIEQLFEFLLLLS